MIAQAVLAFIILSMSAFMLYIVLDNAEKTRKDD